MNIKKDLKKNNAVKSFFPYFVLILVVAGVFFILSMGTNKVNELKTGELLQALKDSKVTEIKIMPKSSESVYYIRGKLKDYKTNESFEAKVVEAEIDSVVNYANTMNIKEYETVSDPGASQLVYIIVQIVPLVFI